MGSSAMNRTMVAGRNSQPALTRPTSAASTVISFDSIDTVSTNFSYVELEDTATEQPSEPALQDKPVVRSQFTRPEFIQHSRFFFDDGNIMFLVEGILYRVHRYFFCRESSEFAAKLLQLSPREHPEEGSLDPIVSLQDVKAEEFDVFLSVLYPQCDRFSFS
ncbi:hypothetical protein BC834DRAFT_913429 [Gloeopeniophorella convolvens]|nr:hypothetical protein BC834DRAFT_913429 [Gloeopeniophorella convolvens]